MTDIAKLLADRAEQLKQQKVVMDDETRHALELAKNSVEPQWVFRMAIDHDTTLDCVVEKIELSVQESTGAPCGIIRLRCTNSDNKEFVGAVLKDSFAFAGKYSQLPGWKKFVLSAVGIDPSVPNLDSIYKQLSPDDAWLNGLKGSKVTLVLTVSPGKKDPTRMFVNASYFPHDEL